MTYNLRVKFRIGNSNYEQTVTSARGVTEGAAKEALVKMNPYYKDAIIYSVEVR